MSIERKTQTKVFETSIVESLLALSESEVALGGLKKFAENGASESTEWIAPSSDVVVAAELVDESGQLAGWPVLTHF